MSANINDTSAYLREHGVNWLTSEAEGVSGLGRVLTDLSPVGADWVEKFLSVKIERSGGINTHEQSSACMMMPRGFAEQLALYIGAVENDIVCVANSGDGFRNHVSTWSNAEFIERQEALRAAYGGSIRFIQKQGDAHGGTANRHAMWGFANG